MKMKAMMKTLLLGGLLIFGFSTLSLRADTVTLSNCSSCFGATFTLTVTQVSGSTYHAVLTIDTSGYTGPGTHISAVSFKATNDVAPPLTLTAAPGGASGWITTQNNTNNAGCASSGSGFVCSEDPAPVSLAPVGGILTWEWDFTLASGSTIFPGLIGGHIGTKFNNSSGTLNGNLVSETIVPEPSTTLLLPPALFLLFLLRRKIQPAAR